MQNEQLDRIESLLLQAVTVSPSLITRAQASEILGIDENTVDHWRRRGKVIGSDTFFIERIDGQLSHRSVLEMKARLSAVK